MSRVIVQIDGQCFNANRFIPWTCGDCKELTGVLPCKVGAKRHGDITCRRHWKKQTEIVQKIKLMVFIERYRQDLHSALDERFDEIYKHLTGEDPIRD